MAQQHTENMVNHDHSISYIIIGSFVVVFLITCVFMLGVF